MANVECTYAINLRERRRIVENLSWFPKDITKIIAEYELLDREDRLAILFHGRAGIRHVGGLTIFWQNAKPNGRTWYYFRCGSYQTREFKLEHIFPRYYTWLHEDQRPHWLWTHLDHCNITSNIYKKYTDKMLELMEYV